ncbi:type IV secretion protein Dot [Fluoribacter dumoffii]|uniref:Dot/Icm T4SS effector Wip n=1 Tax=Fluoribacter dumoffii TaxID=463 RepID=UPI002243B422|nr:Dot/Icm T4SS effector Wip [Fluoribacter dumoffii]MCW8387721.1 type IV secretion protein Dot [Fluoribacter dumoffii]MCW8497924.1 type IV secretion protein Dot [Fluoribacter dumoffii]
MTNRLINKNVDIYKFPQVFEKNLGSITLGDLHGNPIKLIHFLFRQQIIQFKEEVKHAEETYQHFVTLYEQYGDILQEYLENRTLLQFAHVKRDNAQERIANLEKQLREVNSDSQLSQALSLLHQQALLKLETAENEHGQLQQKLAAPKEKMAYCICQFNQFMGQLVIRDNQTLIRLIGDEVADRGNCDYFTLRILNLLNHNHCPLTILASNHGSEFIHAFEQLITGHLLLPAGYIGDVQITSFWGLKLLLEHNLIQQEELIQLVNESYKPGLKILDYTLSEQGITLFSHAPIRFDALQLLAAKLEVHYDDSSTTALAATIDQMNQRFQSYIDKNTLYTLFITETIHDRTQMSEEERTTWPLVYFFWNRWNEIKETETARPAIHNNYCVTYVHGHDGYQSLLPHVHNLDTACGKEARTIENERINKAFLFIRENQNKAVDKTTAESYIREVLRYKVFDSDERSLPPSLRHDNKHLKNSYNNECNNSIKKLGLLGKPIIMAGASDDFKISTPPSTPRELILASEEQDDNILFNLSS